jgi:hypothetical protein
LDLDAGPDTDGDDGPPTLHDPNMYQDQCDRLFDDEAR